MKTCYRCKQNKDESMFSKSSNTSSGLCAYCRECRSIERRSKSWKRNRKRLDAQSRTHKECTGCHAVLPLSAFHKTKTNLDNRSSRCKGCIRLYTLSKRDKNYESRILSRDSIKLGFINHLGGKCSSCGIVPSDMWPVACFDFHHLNDKVERISSLINRREGLAYEELKKCIVLCSNCHRKEHKKISSESRANRLLTNSHDPIYSTKNHDV